MAVVGLGFGAAFVPIYLHHPDVAHVGIVDPDAPALDGVGGRYDVARRHTDLQEVLESDDYDAIHLVTPIPLHAEQAVAVLEVRQALRLHGADGDEPGGPAGHHRRAAQPAARTT